MEPITQLAIGAIIAVIALLLLFVALVIGAVVYVTKRHNAREDALLIRLDKEQSNKKQVEQAALDGWRKAQLNELEITGKRESALVARDMATEHRDACDKTQQAILEFAENQSARMERVVRAAFDVKADRATAEQTLQRVVSHIEGEQRAANMQAAILHAADTERLRNFEMTKNADVKAAIAEGIADRENKARHIAIDLANKDDKAAVQVIYIDKTAKPGDPNAFLTGQPIAQWLATKKEKRVMLTYDLGQKTGYQLASFCENGIGGCLTIPKGHPARIRDLDIVRSDDNVAEVGYALWPVEGTIKNPGFNEIGTVHTGHHVDVNSHDIGPFEQDVTVQLMIKCGTDGTNILSATAKLDILPKSIGIV